MGFTKAKGMKGKIFIPEACDDSRKKHPCVDCFFCQHCSDRRCALCRREPSEKCRVDLDPDGCRRAESP